MWPFKDKRTKEEKELAAKFVESVLAGEWSTYPDGSVIRLARNGVSYSVNRCSMRYHSLPMFLTNKEVSQIKGYVKHWIVNYNKNLYKDIREKEIQFLREAL